MSIHSCMTGNVGILMRLISFGLLKVSLPLLFASYILVFSFDQTNQSITCSSIEIIEELHFITLLASCVSQPIEGSTVGEPTIRYPLNKQRDWLTIGRVQMKKSAWY